MFKIDSVLERREANITLKLLVICREKLKYNVYVINRLIANGCKLEVKRNEYLL